MDPLPAKYIFSAAIWYKFGKSYTKYTSSYLLLCKQIEIFEKQTAKVQVTINGCDHSHVFVIYVVVLFSISYILYTFLFNILH